MSALETSILEKSCFRRIGLALQTAAATTAGVQIVVDIIVTVLINHGSTIPNAGWFLYLSSAEI